MQKTSPMISLYWRATADNRVFRAVLLAVVGSLLLALSAQFKVPFYPVPMTMQTFVLLALALAYGWRLGLATVLLYFAEGALGLPVFAGGGGGLAYFAGPTGGYLLGFLAAAAYAGYMAERGGNKSLMTAIVVLLIADTLIFAFGVTRLAAFFDWDWQKAAAAGLLPFILGDLCKVFLAAALAVGATKISRRH